VNAQGKLIRAYAGSPTKSLGEMAKRRIKNLSLINKMGGAQKKKSCK